VRAEEVKHVKIQQNAVSSKVEMVNDGPMVARARNNAGLTLQNGMIR